MNQIKSFQFEGVTECVYSKHEGVWCNSVVDPNGTPCDHNGDIIEEQRVPMDILPTGTKVRVTVEVIDE